MNPPSVSQGIGIVPSNTQNAATINQNAINTAQANTASLPANSNQGTTFSSQLNPSTNTVGSNYLTPISFQDVASQYQNKVDSMNQGLGATGNPATNGNPLTPSNQLYKQTLANLYQSSLYTPQEQQLISQNADLNSQVNSIKNAANIQAQNSYQAGNMTQSQFNALTGSIQVKANQDLANLTTQQSNIANQMNVFGLQRQNAITANQNLLTGLQPTQVSPGSTLYNPATGVQFQGAGASPAQILSQAQTLLSNDEATGQVHYTPTGQVDESYYQQMAAGQFGGGTQGATGGAQAGSPQGGTAGPTGGATGGSAAPAQTGIAAVPQQLQQYFVQAAGIPTYLDMTKVPAAEQGVIQQYAQKAGIPILDSSHVAGVLAVQGAMADLDGLSNLVNKTLSSGVTGKALDYVKTLGTKVGLFPQLSGFNEARTGAINDIKAIAGGEGSGLRLNSSEIGIATDNLPLSTDNLETAQTKLTWVKAFLQTALSLKVSGQTTDALANAAEDAAKTGNYSLSTLTSLAPKTAGAAPATPIYKSNSGTTYNLPY